jgi:hypothetical protein
MAGLPQKRSSRACKPGILLNLVLERFLLGSLKGALVKYIPHGIIQESYFKGSVCSIIKKNICEDPSKV